MEDGLIVQARDPSRRDLLLPNLALLHDGHNKVVGQSGINGVSARGVHVLEYLLQKGAAVPQGVHFLADGGPHGHDVALERLVGAGLAPARLDVVHYVVHDVRLRRRLEGGGVGGGGLLLVHDHKARSLVTALGGWVALAPRLPQNRRDGCLVRLLLLGLLRRVAGRRGADGNAARVRRGEAHVVLELERPERVLEVWGDVLPVENQGEDLIPESVAAGRRVAARHDVDQRLAKVGRAREKLAKVLAAIFHARVGEREDEAANVRVAVVEPVGEGGGNALLDLGIAPVHEVHDLHVQGPVRPHQHVARGPMDHLPNVGILVLLEVHGLLGAQVGVVEALVPEKCAQAIHLSRALSPQPRPSTASTHFAGLQTALILPPLIASTREVSPTRLAGTVGWETKTKASLCQTNKRRKTLGKHRLRLRCHMGVKLPRRRSFRKFPQRAKSTVGTSPWFRSPKSQTFAFATSRPNLWNTNEFNFSN